MVETKKKMAPARKAKAVKLVTAEIRPDSGDFLPVGDGEFGFDLKVGNLSEEQSIPPRMCFVLDGGMEIDIPKGMKVQVQVNEDWSKKGLVIAPSTYGSGPQRLRFVAHNVGKQILAFTPTETIGKFWLSQAAEVGLVPTRIELKR
jgi:hypothetical protein